MPMVNMFNHVCIYTPLGRATITVWTLHDPVPRIAVGAGLAAEQCYLEWGQLRSTLVDS
jgi:hypothetical protein